jgi:hypothetical protein
MRKNGSLLPAACGLLVGIGAGLATAQTAPAADAAAESARAFDAPITVYPGTKQYVWTLYVPELETERVAVVANVPVLHMRAQRWDYELPDLKSQRVKLGQVFEFSCKYPDWILPQECHTEWRDVYADLPVLAMRRDHLDYDAAEWDWEEQTLHIDLPHWSWRESTLTVSVPTFGPREAEQAQATLDAQQAATTKTIDQGIEALDASIAAVEAQGADPRRLSAAGTPVDLPAMRQTLRDQKAGQLEQLAAIRGTLRALSAAAPDPGEPPRPPDP